MSLADLKGFTEKYGLNSRLVKQNGKLVEEVYRLDGKYWTQIVASSSTSKRRSLSPSRRW